MLAMNLRRAGRSLAVQVALWSLGLFAYHFLSSAIDPDSRMILRSTFPLYAIVRPVFNAWAIPPVIVFVAWVFVLRWHKEREFKRIPVSLIIAFVFALHALGTDAILFGATSLSMTWRAIGGEHR